MSTATDRATARLSPEALARNFADAHPPLDRQQALVEADRCYFCYDAPCVKACPTEIDIPSFIRKIATDNLKGSATDILSANIMGGACARVCPTEILCEGACVRNLHEHKPVNIGGLQRHATDWLFARGEQIFTRAPETGRHVAVVGGGPAGLACAHALAVLGHAVTVFEARPKLGGLNEYGIAAYKVPDAFAQHEVDYILSIGGITVKTNTALGRDVTLAELQAQFDAVFLSIGLGATKALGIAGDTLAGVEPAVAFIERLRQASDLSALAVPKRVVVIGGGNTAIDAATQAKRLGAEDVTLVYRRGPEAMSATVVEQEWAQTNGVRIKHWARPLAVLGDDGAVSGVRFASTALADDGTLVDVGATFEIAADAVLTAIGQTLSQESAATEPVALQGGRLAVDGQGRTSLAGVWAGGDCVGNGQDLTVAAVRDGRNAAASIHTSLIG
jgi:dihydropyrimidine dehydrogenase (NAD+) subunit PreT